MSNCFKLKMVIHPLSGIRLQKQETGIHFNENHTAQIFNIDRRHGACVDWL